MKNLFNYDNQLVLTLERLGNDILLGILWLLFCLPIVTIVPASAAAYHTMIKVVKDSGNGVVKDFISAFVSNIKQGILLTLIIAVLGILIYTGLNLGWQLMAGNLIFKIYFCLGLLIAVFVLSSAIYLPAILSRFQMKTMELLRASMFIVIGRPVKSFLLALVLCVFCFLIWYFPTFIMIIPGLYCDMISSTVEKELHGITEKYDLHAKTEGTIEQDTDMENAGETTPFQLNELMEKKRRMEIRDHGKNRS